VASERCVGQAAELDAGTIQTVVKQVFWLDVVP
jgi:hypothetical protein